MKRYKDDIAKKKVCADCIGGAKGYAWTNGGQGVLEAIGTDKGISNKSGANGCPDTVSYTHLDVYKRQVPVSVRSPHSFFLIVDSG